MGVAHGDNVNSVSLVDGPQSGAAAVHCGTERAVLIGPVGERGRRGGEALDWTVWNSWKSY